MANAKNVTDDDFEKLYKLFDELDLIHDSEDTPLVPPPRSRRPIPFPRRKLVFECKRLEGGFEAMKCWCHQSTT